MRRSPLSIVALLVALTGVGEARGAPPNAAPALPTPHATGPQARVLGQEARAIARFYDDWRFAEADRGLAVLEQARPGEYEATFLRGYERFLSGDYPVAAAKLGAVLARWPQDADARSLLGLVRAAETATRGHREKRSAHFAFRYPPEDEVLAEYALETLEAAALALHDDLGFVPERLIPVDIYRSPADLAAVSTLSPAEVERTGTIALCKWARLMATSPRALRVGYPWQDSITHELVHYVIASLTHDRTPVWLQEGLAKFFERRWREPAGGELPPSMQHLLAKALASRKLITFEAMHPSMAKLPRAEDATLAFAEVATAVASLHARGGMAAVRNAVVRVSQGTDAREAVAAALGGTWLDFEKGWKAFMAAKHYKTFPGMDPVTRKFRKPAAIASKRGPSEDEETPTGDGASRFLRLGNMMLLAHRPRAAASEYEKGARAAGPGNWIFAVKLGRTYLALGLADRALKAVGGAQTLYPELPWPHLIAGQAYLALGNAERAALALMASLGINPFDPNVHCGLVDAYRRLPVSGAWTTDRRTRADRHCRELSAQ